MTEPLAAGQGGWRREGGWALGIGLVFVAHAAWLACMAEDAFISFRFARNLAAGLGFVWNPGEAPVEGFTNLLWVLVGAAVERLGLPQPRLLQGLGIVAGLLLLAAVDRFAARVLGFGWPARLVTGLLLAASGPLATWAASGLETVPYTLLGFCTLLAMARWLERQRPADLVQVGLFAALATLTRPEGPLWLAAAGVLALVAGARPRPLLLLGAGFAAFLVALTAWRLAVFGMPLPNTFYAKTGGGALQALRGARYAGYFAFHYLLPLLPLLPLALAGLGRTSSAGRAPADAPLARPGLAALGTLVALQTLYVVGVGGDYMAMYRFFVPIVPGLVLLVVAASMLAAAGAAWRPQLGLVALALVGTGVQSTPLEGHLFVKSRLQHGTYRGVETERWHVERLRVLARFFAARAAATGRTGASVATGAIGVIGYESGLAVLDFNGLVDPVIARGGSPEGQVLGAGLPGHEKANPARTLTQRPTYWMFDRQLRERGGARPKDLDAATLEALARDYVPVEVWLEDAVNGEAGTFTFLERRPDR